MENRSIRYTLILIMLISLACCSNSKPETLQETFTGNTIAGKDYATWFPDDDTAVMDWQGRVSVKRWWVDEGKFCHNTDDGFVCEEVKKVSEGSYEFCGRWGCFPAELEKGNSRKMSVNLNGQQ